jgi:hypothetical protein
MARPQRIVVLGTVLALASVLAWPASASHIERKNGECSGPSSWRLVVRAIDDATLKIRVEISHSSAGQTWAMFVTDNGNRVIRNTKVANADGFVRWVRLTADLAGADQIDMAANNRDSGETCGASLTYSHA